MGDASVELEARLAALEASHRSLEARLAALEGRAAAPAAVARTGRRPRSPLAEERLDVQAELAGAGRGLALAGRLLLVLAGAFVLRALTDGGTLPPGPGLLAGFLYAGAFVALADRAAAAGRRSSAVVHGLGALMVGFPLVVESVTRFALVPVAVAAAALGLLSAGALAVAWRRRFEPLAWLVAVGGVLAAGALALTTRQPAPPLTYLVALGLALLWIAWLRGWRGLPWPVAAVTDLLAAVLALGASGASAGDGAGTALLLLATLAALHLGSVAVRALALRAELWPFDLAQGAAVLVVALGGAGLLARNLPAGAAVLGAAALAAGLAAYGVAFARLDADPARRLHFHAFCGAGLALVTGGAALALPAASLLLALVAVGAAAAGRALGRPALAAHAALLATAAALGGGLVGEAGPAFFASAAELGPVPPPAALAVLACLVAVAGVTAPLPPPGPLLAARLPRVALLAAVACGAGSIAVHVAVPLVAGAPPALDVGAVAAVRSAVLAVGAVALAAAGRAAGFREAGWLAYPVLALAGAKLLLEDLPRGRAATLVLAFAACGLALIAVPRIRRRPVAPAARPDGAVAPVAGEPAHRSDTV